MDYNVFLLIFLKCTILFIFSHGIDLTEEQSDLDIKKYLHERETYMDRRIYYYFEETTDEKQFDFVYNTSQIIVVPNRTAHLHLCVFFGRLYLTSGNDIRKLSYHDGKFTLNPPSFLMNEAKITLIKSYEHNGFGFLMVASQNYYVNIFGLQKDSESFFFIQSISGGSANVDFFVNENDLYLVTTDNTKGTLEIYKWTSSYFDRIEQITINTVVSISTFKNGNSSILVTLQNLDESTTTTVYEFHREKLHKIQKLDIKHPTQIIGGYIFNGEMYVVIVDSSAKGVLYWWDGSQLIKWNIMNDTNLAEPSHIAHVQNYPFIFNTKKNLLIAHTHILNNIEMVSNKQLKEYFVNTSNIKYVYLEEKNFIFIVGANGSANNIIEVVDFSVKHNEIENDDNKKDALLQCLCNLEQKLHTKRKPQLKKYFETNATTAPVFGSARNVEFTTKKYGKQVTEIKEKLFFLKNSTEAYKNDLSGDKKMVFKGKIVIKGSLKGSVLKAKSIHTDYLNEKKWEANDLLSYMKPQIITTKVFFSDLNASEITVTADETFKNLLQHTGNQIISGGVHHFDSFKAEKLFAQTINGVQIDNIYLRSSNTTISGTKQINSLITNSVNIKLLNGAKLHKTNFANYTYNPDVYVDNFNFENLNGINWGKFTNNLFRIGKDHVINGTLNVPTFKTTRLSAVYINSIPTNNLLTTSTKQTVNSTIHFNNIDVANITVQTLNDIKIEDVAYPGDLIKGHVRIDKVHVTGDLNIHGTDKIKGNNHIVGTNESDLLQIYNKKVKIVGNLYLKNLFFMNTAAVYVEGENFCSENLKSYWLKNTHQIIPVHFSAQNGLSAVHLRCDRINGVPLTNYMLNDSDEKPPTDYYFENVTITGDVLVNENSIHIPDLQTISKTAVRLQGVYTIKGTKRFSNRMKITHLKTDYLDDKDAFAALTKKNNYKITGTKYFETLVIKENLNADDISTSFINGYNLKSLISDSVYIDQPFVIENAYFEQLKVENLHTDKLNNEEFKNYFRSINEINGDILDVVEILGDIKIRSVQNLVAINNIDVNNILKNSVKTNENTSINGNITFRGNVRIGDLKVAIINGINFDDLNRRLLHKNSPQNIEARHVFNSIKTTNVNTPKVNNLDVAQLIDVKETNPQKIYLKNVLRLGNVTFWGPTKANLMCDLYDARLKLQTNPLKTADKISVLKDAEILDKNSPLSYILRNAVVKNMNNTIRAPVIFKKHIIAKNVFFGQLVNNVNVSYIYGDALMKDSNVQQVISGRKTFNDLKLEDVTVMTNINVPEINGIVIKTLDDGIIYKNFINDIVVRGRKTFFSGIQTGSLHGKSSMITNNLVSSANLKPIPSVIFSNVEIDEDLNVDYVNSNNFGEILHKRLKISGDTAQEAFGIYYFDDFIVNNNSYVTTTHFNNINIDDIIFDEGIQSIDSPKVFVEDCLIFGNAEITQINNIDVNEAYKNTIFRHENVGINGNVILTKNAQIRGDFNTDKLNNISVEQLEKNTEMEVTKIKSVDARNVLNEVSEIVKNSIAVIKEMPSKYLYLEKAEELQLSIPKATNAQAIQTKGEVMIHIAAVEKGSSCGLPEECSCPLQETLHITPHLSINSIINKGSQRIFSYDDEQMTIHLITNTISTDSKCRTNPEEAANEISSLMWNTANFGNETGHYHIFPGNFKGYVSGVEFFRANGYTYAIIALFYNPVLDTHDLEYQIIRFTEKKDGAEIVQKIPAKGAWTLSVFNTAQGVTLVTGGVGDNVVQMYRFHQNEFKLLRNVFNLQHATAAGVILGEDSWIILAEKSRSLQIFKYSHDYDNYYFYQYLQVDSEVSGISVFYGAEFNQNERGDAYLSVVTKSGMFYIYSFRYIEGWKLEFNGAINDLQRLVPFNLKKQTYLFGPSSDLSNLLTFTTQGFN